MKAKIRIDHELLAVEAEHSVHCMIELDVPEAPSDDRRPLDIALVVDRSGSMAGAKLDVAKKCARFLIRRLAPGDRLALVAYDDAVDLVAPLAPIDGPKLEHALAQIAPGGTTNLSGGWLKGLEELRRGADSDRVRRALLLTDGLANVGITDNGQLVAIAAGTKEQAATTTIGFGAGFDEDLLAAIADSSGGATYFAENPEDAPGIFAEEFTGLATLVAQNVSVEIRPAHPVAMVGVLNEYPITDVPGGLQVQLGDAYGSECRRVVFGLHVPELASLGVMHVADVIVRYVSVSGKATVHEIKLPVTVNLVSADEAAAAEVDHEVVEEIVVIEAARARREARDRADHGDFEGAGLALTRAGARLRDVAGASKRLGELLCEADLLDRHAATMSTFNYGAAERKRLSSESWRRHRGRRI